MAMVVMDSSMNVGFNATRLAWLERGGVWAIAHVRGGGELARSGTTQAAWRPSQTHGVTSLPPRNIWFGKVIPAQPIWRLGEAARGNSRRESHHRTARSLWSCDHRRGLTGHHQSGNHNQWRTQYQGVWDGHRGGGFSRAFGNELLQQRAEWRGIPCRDAHPRIQRSSG